MKIKTLAFLLLLLLAAIPVFSQKKSEKTPPAPIEVKANVLVLDAAGQQVNDIKAEDLKIFEDGVEQKITYFAKKENALNVGFAIDNTGTMRSNLELVIESGKILTNNLRPTDEAFVLRFVSTDKIQLLENWTNDKELLQMAHEGMYPESGDSAVIDAVYLAASRIVEREKKEPAKRYALILISDGEDRASRYNQKALFDLLKDTELQIFPIAFVTAISRDGDPKKVENFVHQLAFETGGKAFPIKSQKDTGKSQNAQVSDAIKAIIIELRSQYTVGYTSTNQKRGGAVRKLTVQIADGTKRQAVIRENFVVPEDK